MALTTVDKEEDTSNVNIIINITADGEILNTIYDRFVYWKKKILRCKKKIEILNDENDQLEITKQTLEADIFQLLEQREQLTAEIETLHSEKAQLETNKEEIKNEVLQLVGQKEPLQGEIENFNLQKQQINNEVESLRIEEQRLLAANLKLTNENTSLLEEYHRTLVQERPTSPETSSMSPQTKRRHRAKFDY